jgi:NAD(P)-dependent dehydrogenase (short-subunit alcohol dehydrogenase family)
VPTPQVPIGSGFNSASTAAEVIKGIDLAGKTAIVTGGYSGLGRETTRELRAAGARVIVPARDPERATAALAGIDVEIEPMDLLDPVAIDAFAERYLTSCQPLHILVNSAGIMRTRSHVTREALSLSSRPIIWGIFSSRSGCGRRSPRRTARGWFRYRHGDTIFLRSFSMISISSVGIIIPGRPTVSRRRPTSCSRSRSMKAERRMACEASHSIRGAYPALASKSISRLRNSGPPV